MPRHRRAALLFVALASAAFAGFSNLDFPTLRPNPLQPRGVRQPSAPPVRPSGQNPHSRPSATAPRGGFSAPVLEARAIDQAGHVTRLPTPEDLSEPLAAPPGTVDVELDLGGPVQLWLDSGDGAQTLSLDLPTLSFALEDPDALEAEPTLWLDLDLNGILSAPTEQDARALLRDGALALPG